VIEEVPASVIFFCRGRKSSGGVFKEIMWVPFSTSMVSLAQLPQFTLVFGNN
jgi:hypothetical protein